ncbi:HNH endonuclease, partial [Cronobacter sakazakii]|nr:HNH endonuclease [Cronobacter sakazakii]
NATKVTNGTTIEQLCLLLSNRKPEISVFTENFRDILFTDDNSKQKRLVQYIINKFEMARHNGDEYRPNSISLEHIMPQSAGNDKEIGMIGNIIPLSKELNEQAGNKSLAQKLSIYSQSEFRLTEEFISELETIYHNEWNLQSIIQKTDRMAGEAYMNIWSH